MADFQLGDNKALVEYIRDTRKVKRIGLRELARKAKLPASNLCSIEKGRVQLTDKAARRLLRALGMSVRVVVEQDMPPVRPF